MTKQPLPTDFQMLLMLLMLNDFLVTMDILAVKELGGERRVVTPRLVLSAFVLEIELKCLLVHRGIRWPTHKGKGHDLKLLFNLLPEPERKRIQKIHREQASTHGSSAGQADDYFHKTLNMAKDDFMTVRYVFEKVGGHETRNLGPIMLAVYSYIFEVCPEWIEHKLDFDLSH